MGSVQVSTEGAGNKGSAEFNYHDRDEGTQIEGSVAGEAHGLSEEDESRINEVIEDVNDESKRIVQASHSGLLKQQQQPQGPFVLWKRFLPLGSLKVLLVENDDSTRHVVSALLRNCSYEVTAAANGLQAWKILEDLTNHIDLVLTEVVMPCLNGIGLLCKIMSHKTCKNIPVIMMSSHDSMGIVFKCLSKGAVDFLVKPIRKNELKNLWQHVWRRCHSSSGSGSESGIQTKKSVKSKSTEKSENNTGSNNEDDNTSVGLNVRDGSDNGSDTQQSSWTKWAVEVDSPQAVSPSDLAAKPHDSTCALVIHPKLETFCNKWVTKSGTLKCQEQKELPDDVDMGKDFEIGMPTNSGLQLQPYSKEKVGARLKGKMQDKVPDLDSKIENEETNEALELDNNSPSGKVGIQAAELIGSISNTGAISQRETVICVVLNGLSEISRGKAKAIDDSKELPSLDLCLKSRRSVGDSGSATHEDRNVLRRSDLSAFSRYNTATAATQTPTGFGESCSAPPDNSSEAVKTESMYNFSSSSNAALPNQGSNESSNNNDMESTTKNALAEPAASKEKSALASTANRLHPSSAFQPVQSSYPPQQVLLEKFDDVPVDAGQPRRSHHQVQVYIHHDYDGYNVHNMRQQLPPPDHDDLYLKSMTTTTPQCGSSNVFGGPVEGNAGNYSWNGSVSGSNHGSNGANGSSTAVNAGGTYMESDNGTAAKSGTGGGSGINQNRFAQKEAARVAALTKFRQKRKERNFEKKVRYQSRKRLAEQRPWVRSQFVQQNVLVHSSCDTDS